MTGLATYDNLFFKSKSVRKRTIKITDGKEFEETKEGLSFKKIIKSVQGSVPKGTKKLEYNIQIEKVTKLALGENTMGRSKKIGR